MLLNYPTKTKSDQQLTFPETLSSPLIDRLIQEYKTILKHELSRNGIYIIPNNTTLIWTCIVLIRSGPYKTGKFKAKLYIPQEYPETNVKVYFKTRIYHPLINLETGELDTKKFTKFSSNRIEILALFIKSIFTDHKCLRIINSFNPEAGKSFVENKDLFEKKVQESIHIAGADQINDCFKTQEQDQENIKDIREVISTLVKCTGDVRDKVDVLIENAKNIVTNDL